MTKKKITKADKRLLATGRLIKIGEQLSNIAYNLGQETVSLNKLSEDECRRHQSSMRECSREWDVALREYWKL